MVSPSQQQQKKSLEKEKKSLKGINGHSFILSRVMLLKSFLTTHVQPGIVMLKKSENNNKKIYFYNIVFTIFPQQNKQN